MCNAGGGRNLSSTHAFTLAEVLVTLGIIGVVSAMTVPSLMQNHQRKTYVTQLHKVYNELSQALLQYQTDKNAVNLKEAGLTSQVAINEFITNYFKIVQSCEKTDPCFASDYKHIAGQAGEFEKTNSYVLSSGASIRPRYYPDGNILSAFVVDINGQKGPNIVGRDLFAMYIYNNGIIDDNSPTNIPPFTEEIRETLFAQVCNSSSSTSIYGCFGKILNDNWEMTY